MEVINGNINKINPDTIIVSGDEFRMEVSFQVRQSVNLKTERIGNVFWPVIQLKASKDDEQTEDLAVTIVKRKELGREGGSFTYVMDVSIPLQDADQKPLLGFFSIQAFYTILEEAEDGSASEVEAALDDVLVVQVVEESATSTGPNSAADEFITVMADLNRTVGDFNNKFAQNRTVNARLIPNATHSDPSVALWLVILKTTEALSFSNYMKFMDLLFCGDGSTTVGALDELENNSRRRFLPFTDTDSYRAIKVATESFVMANCGVQLQPYEFENILAEQNYIDDPDFTSLLNDYLVKINGSDDSVIPYLSIIREKLADQPIKQHTIEHALESALAKSTLSHSIGFTSAGGGRKISPSEPVDRLGRISRQCYGVISNKLQFPCFLELIWSYWHEEAMQVQAMNAISQRFQNVKAPGKVDPLAHMEVDPLRPLSNILWGYIQDEQHRLTVKRRAYEYDHHYGISLSGKAITNFRPVDSRSRFLEAFHSLLYLCVRFFEQEDDTTIVADAFPVLNALKEVHLILSEGAHNQYGDLPSTARIEMLMQQWILGRPEFREFLPTRIMVAYPERWMDRVAAMNTIQGWTNTNILHFHNLGVFGEQVLLSIRFGAWAGVNNRNAAANWAKFWREQIQGYIHAYRAATGVDLTARYDSVAKIDAVPPSVHLKRRLVAQKQYSSNGQLKAKVK